jgi:hypothetical protein
MPNDFAILPGRWRRDRGGPNDASSRDLYLVITGFDPVI